MSPAAIAEDDPYILPMPTANSPVVLPKWISAGNPHANSRYGEDVWSLGPLVDSPGASVLALHWHKNCPRPLQPQLRLITWTMINGELRPTYLRTRGTGARGRNACEHMHGTVLEWMKLARWLHARGVADLAACQDPLWREYAAHRMSEIRTRVYGEKILGWLTDLWSFDQLAARPAGISRPPWDIEGVDDFLPAIDEAGGGENSTEPLDPKVLGPLLVWAIRMVDDFADDILAAWQENRRMTSLAATTPSTKAGAAALDSFLRPLIESGAAIPANRHGGSTKVARTYLSATTGASQHQVDRIGERLDLAKLAAAKPGPCPLPSPVTGQIDGQPWRQHLDFNEAPGLMRHLGTAAMIIILYLTGMRPQEVQALHSGCCPEPEPQPDGSPGRHLIRSHHFKNVTNDDGHHVSAGEERSVPWVAITPVVHAIRVLERIVPTGDLLFSAAHHDFVHQRGNHGALKQGALHKRIEDFVEWANAEADSQGLHDQTIPEDPHGAIGIARFRRTLAWHIARRPGGLIALAIQYGHMRTLLDARTSSGYGTRSRRGMHAVINVETALAAADTAAQLRDRIENGEKISGPAARRAIMAATQAPRFEGRIVLATFASKAANYLARDGVVLFDNPDAFLICAFKRDNALCEPDPGANAPNQFACRPGCGNAVRTDTHARLLRAKAGELDQLATLFPEPIARQLLATARDKRSLADTHDATAESAEALT